MKKIIHVVALSTITVVSSCIGVDFTTKCESLCDDDDNCNDEFDTECVQDCLERTEGVSEGCARCIIDNSQGPSDLGNCAVEFTPVSDDVCVDFCA